MLDQYPEPPSCDCEDCSMMCKRPCWPTPEEAERLIEEGYADRLMVDDWWGRGEEIEVLCPANKGYEKENRPWSRRTVDGCTFWIEGKCALHDLKLKPCEGRYAHHDEKLEIPDLHDKVAATWDSSKGRSLLQKWKKLIWFTSQDLEE